MAGRTRSLLKSRTLFYTGYFYAFFAVLGAVAIVTTSRPFLIPVFVLEVIAFATMAYRSFTNGIWTSAEGLIARGDWFTRRLAWNDVAKIEFRGLRGLGVVRRDGTWVRLSYYGGMRPDLAAGAAVRKLAAEMAKRVDMTTDGA